MTEAELNEIAGYVPTPPRKRGFAERPRLELTKAYMPPESPPVRYRPPVLTMPLEPLDRRILEPDRSLDEATVLYEQPKQPKPYVEYYKRPENLPSGLAREGDDPKVSYHPADWYQGAETWREDAPPTVQVPEVPTTVREQAISGFGPKRASVAAMVKLDAKAQQLAYDRWSSAMKGLGEPRDYNDDYVRNMAPVNERIRMDEPDGAAAYDATVAEFIRADVQKADPKAQARFRKYVDIYRKQLMRKKFGE